MNVEDEEVEEEKEKDYDQDDDKEHTLRCGCVSPASSGCVSPASSRCVSPASSGWGLLLLVVCQLGRVFSALKVEGR